MKLKVTDTKTGKVYVDENEPHSWSDLCLDIMNRYKDIHLIYCDIECLAKDNTWKEGKDNKCYVGEQWYLLDECGGYATMPEEYKIEEIKE